MRLEVECLEAELADLGPTWTTATCPAHADGDDGAPRAKAASSEFSSSRCVAAIFRRGEG